MRVSAGPVAVSIRAGSNRVSDGSDSDGTSGRSERQPQPRRPDQNEVLARAWRARPAGAMPSDLEPMMIDPPRRLWFGGDYNPEQWTPATHDEDIRLMILSGVSLVTVGVFSWAHLEPQPGVYNFDWLETILDQLHLAGISVDLATGTASPPPWLATLDPDTLPIDRQGRRRGVGGRQACCPSSATWRHRSRLLVEQVATRFAEHPAIVLWHVGNEYGCNTPACYCPACAREFRGWLLGKYGYVEAVNEAWGTTFWSQHYARVDDIQPPRITPDGTIPNPSQELDYRRFCSDLLLSAFIGERDVLKRLSPGIPVTTNFMVMSRFNKLDYWRWAREVDVVSNDHYPSSRPDIVDAELALCADVTRGLSGNAPWLLMETAPGAVNWRAINQPRPPGQLKRHMIQHLARGADGVLFFQWRASAAGAEKFHSGMIPHAGTDTRIFREVSELGAIISGLQELRGSRVLGQVAMMWDWESWWAEDFGFQPTSEFSYFANALDLHRSLGDARITVDIVSVNSPLDSYPLVVVPSLYLTSAETSRRLDDYVQRGGTLLVTYWSGISDEHDRVWLGGYPGALRDTLGIWVEEFNPLRPDELLQLSDGGEARVWSEFLHLRGASAVSTYLDGPTSGMAAVTRHSRGRGAAWYVATRLDRASLARLMSSALDDAGVAPLLDADRGLEVTVRRGEAADYALIINHGSDVLAARCVGLDLVTGERRDAPWQLSGGELAVIRLDKRVHSRHEGRNDRTPGSRS